MPNSRNAVVAIEYTGTMSENYSTPEQWSRQYAEFSLLPDFATVKGNTTISTVTHAHYFGDWKPTVCVKNLKALGDGVNFNIEVKEKGDYKIILEYAADKTDANAFCAGNDSSYQFLEKVFAEVTSVFPFEYIHIGGDECNKSFWSKCPVCQNKKKDAGLKVENELHSYFIRRVEKILEANGKKLMDWDEILEGGLAPYASVMSLRGMEGGIEAAKQNHPVVMTPTSYCYLDLFQGDPAIEPPTYSMLRFKTVYGFEPVPAGVNEKLILGGQGNLWTESVPQFRQAEYMLWPRSLALAEVLWSPTSTRNWIDFVSRFGFQLQRLNAAGTNYANSFYDILIFHFRNG